MTGHTLNASNGATYKVVKLLPRPGGTVDLIVAYRVRGRKTTYAAYRYEPDGTWKALNNGWLSLDKALEEIGHSDGYRPLASPDLRDFLAAAIGQAEHADKPAVGGGPDIGGEAEDLYRTEKGT